MSNYGPIFHLHPDDKYRPDSAEYVYSSSTYKKCTVHNEDNFNDFRTECPGTGSHEWMDIPDSLYSGSMERAKAYVHRKKIDYEKGFTDFLVYLFFPYNGAGFSYAFCGKIDLLKKRLDNAGSHEGDWEHVTIRIQHGTIEKPEKPRPVKMYLSRHAGGKWLAWDSLETDGVYGRKIVYAAKNSHAFYESTGLNEYCNPKKLNVGVCTFRVTLRDEAAKGVAFDTSKNYKAFDPESVVLKFKGRWGDYIKIDEDVKFNIRKSTFCKGWQILHPVYAAICAALPEITVFPRTEVSSGPKGPAEKDAWTKEDADDGKFCEEDR